MTKAEINFIRSLHDKKSRRENGLFIAEGKKTIEELLNFHPNSHRKELVREIYVQGDTALPFPKYKGTVKVVSVSEMQKISALVTPQGILAVCAIPDEPAVPPDFHTELILALDCISDPGNMGTIIRIAHWFGIRHIYCSPNCTDVYSPKVVQASMGSIAGVAIHYSNLHDFLNKAVDVPIYGAMLKGNSVYGEKLKSNGILIIGNESNGISKEIAGFIKHPLTIPSFSNSIHSPDSLNAAVAAAVICSEFRRRAHP